MLSKDSASADTMEANEVIAYSIVGFFVFGTCCMGGCATGCTGGDGFFVVFILAGLARVSVLIMSSVCISTLNQIGDVSSANLDLLNEHESVDCSDELSRVATGQAITAQNSSIDSVTKGVTYLAVLIALISCESLCVCCSTFLAASGCRSCDCSCNGAFGDCLDEAKEEGASFFAAYKKLN